MRRRRLLHRSGVALLGALALLGASTPSPDAIDTLLSCGGLSRGDLGARPRGDWLGTPRALPGEMPFVGTLRAHPLRLPLFADGLESAAETYGSQPERLFQALAIAPRLPGFGLYGANLPEETDLARALTRLRRPLADGRLPSGSFGNVLREPVQADAVSTRDAGRLPAELRAPLARLLAALADADAWVRVAWRRVPPATARSAVARTGLLAAIPDGATYFPDVEDAARDLDAESLAYAGLEVFAAVERAGGELAEVARRAPTGAFATLTWDVETPRGTVRVRGTGRDRHDGGERLLLDLDLGGDDAWRGAAGSARWPEQPVSVAIDLSGDDRYEAEGAAQGSGRGGVGMLLDLAGDDVYRAAREAQGYGQLGVGVLLDGAGNDDYGLGESGQGAAVLGIGLLLDRAGDDAYEVLHEGQGVGGPSAVGLLVDLAGDDRYVAVPDPARAGRPDPRADGKASTSNAQGVGLGRRGDGSDGHAWPGGLGALLDLAGRDTYRCGTWCQGVGYWLGTGVLVDGGGDDTYEATWYAQGSAAHHALGVLLDRSGNDRHVLSGTGGAGLGFGWDFATGVLADLTGNDTYEARRWALGTATQRSTALFLDAAGDDRYLVLQPGEAFGWVDDDPRWAARRGFFPALFEASQVGLFLDLDGSDLYPPGAARDGGAWGSWDRGLAAPRNLGAGIDGSRLRLPQELAPLVR